MIEEPSHADPRTEVEYREYRSGDADAVLAMYQSVLGRARSAAEVAHRLEQGPSGPAERYVIVDGDQVVGHMALVPLPAWVHGELTDVLLAVDGMVRADYRGRGLYRALLDSIRPEPRQLGVSFLLDTPAAGVRKRLTGSEDENRVPQWVRWTDAARLGESWGRSIPRPVSWLVDGALWSTRALPRIASRKVTVINERPADTELDEMARSSRDAATVVHRRDAAFVRWRWSGHDGSWSFWSARDRRGRLIGWTVCGIDPMRTGRHGVVGDMVTGSRSVTSALLVAAADSLVASGAEIVTFSYRDPRRWSSRAVRAAGFVRRGVAPSMMPFTRTQEVDELCRPHHWYVTTALFV